MRPHSVHVGAYLACALLFSAAAHASLLPSAELIGGSGGNINVPANSTGLTYDLTAPGTYNYGDSFSSDPPDLTGIPNLSGGVTYNFYDDFFIQVPTASVDTLTSSINLDGVIGLTNLDARIYSLTSNPGGLVLGVPSGGATEGWGNTVNYADGVSQATQVIGPVTLGAGDYVLEIRAQTDSEGGSYAGVINLTPVPLPASLPLLLSGLTALGIALRRRRILAS